MRTSILLGILLLTILSCTKQELGKTPTANFAGPETVKLSVAMYERDSLGNPGTKVYDSTEGGSPTALKEAPQSYFIDIAVLDGSADHLSITATIEQVNIVNPPAGTVQNFKIGRNVWTSLAPGDYALNLVGQIGEVTYPSESFFFSIVCDNPVALNAAAIDISQLAISGSENVYSFDAGSVIGAGIGGKAPLSIALDVNGDGSRDVAFQPASQAFSNIYVNYDGNRKLGVIVRDACNSAVSAQGVRAIPLVSAIIPGPTETSTFIHAQVYQAFNSALNYAGIYSPLVGYANYWAKNHGGSVKPMGAPVMPQVTVSGDNITFRVASDKFTYGQPSSLTFGASFTISGGKVAFTTTGNVVTAAIDMSNAVLSQASYSTDQNGDGQPALKVSTTSCTGTFGANMLPATGIPCGGGSTESLSLDLQFHVWATSFDCPALTGPNSASVGLRGEFNGLPDLPISCTGGGQGGGGVPPRDF